MTKKSIRILIIILIIITTVIVSWGLLKLDKVFALSSINDFKLSNISNKNISTNILTKSYKPTQLEIRQKILKNFKITEEYKNKILDIPTIMFHYIEEPKNKIRNSRYWLSYSPKRLENLLVFLKENNIEAITFWDIADAIKNNKELPEKSVILTFDDGHLNHYTKALPILKKHQVNWVFFIVSEFPDNDSNYADWWHIKQILKAWNEIWSHTLDHQALSTLSKSNIIKELKESKEKIEFKIWEPIITICYPSGKYNNTVLNESDKLYLFGRTTRPWKQINLNSRFTIPTIRSTPTLDTEWILDRYFE